MAAFFGETVAAHLASERIGLAFLVRLGFIEGEIRLWNGSGDIIAGGETWSGIGKLGGISSISSGGGDVAALVTLTLSGIDDEITARTAPSADIRGRPVKIYLQFFAGDTGKPLDDPSVVWSGSMDLISVDQDATSNVISLACEGLFTNRSKPPAGMLTDMDQKARSPTDRGLEFVTAVANASIPWPSY